MFIANIILKNIYQSILLDIVEYCNNAIAKSARNPLISLLPTSLPPTSLPSISLLSTSLPPTFKPLISPSIVSKKFNSCYAFIFLKRQANRIAAQNVKYKIAFKSYILAIPF